MTPSPDHLVKDKTYQLTAQAQDPGKPIPLHVGLRSPHPVFTEEGTEAVWLATPKNRGRSDSGARDLELLVKQSRVPVEMGARDICALQDTLCHPCHLFYVSPLLCRPE